MLRTTHGLCFALAMVLLGALYGPPATSQEEGDQGAQQLDRLRREIQEIENRLNQNRSREQNLLTELEDYDRQIALRLELVDKLEKERRKTQKALEKSERDLGFIRSDLDRTRGDSLRTASERSAIAGLAQRRAVYVYKFLRRDVLRALLTSSSLGQWLTRRQYLEKIAAADRGNLERLEQKNIKLASLSQQLSRRHSEESDRLQRYRRMVAYKERLLAEEKSESQTLKDRRAEREALLKRVRQDKELLARQIEEKRQAALLVESLIKSLEVTRAKIVPPPAPKAATAEIPFSQLKGRMAWPATGKVLSRFGIQRHEKLATITENPGIDIGAVEGADIQAVCSGKVTKITWLRGYGNTVILDHQDGYYTVYAHLGQIGVNEGQSVRTGEILGQVGQSGSITGPRLHFEIWAQREKQDPLLWLTNN